jgi:hypothetical protein
MSKKKTVFNAYDLLNSPEMSAYLDQVEAEESERQKRRDAEMAARQRRSGSKPGHSVSDDELSADDLKRDNIRQTTDDISGRANDVWQALKSGGAQLIQGAGWLANEAGAHDSGQFLRDIGQIGEDQALANMTPAGREAQKNGVFKEDLSGVNDDWGRGMAQGIAGSAVPSIVGAVLGAPVARGIGAAGEALLGRAAVSEGALGSVLDAAIKYTPAPVMRLAGALPGAAGAGAGEAAVTGATNGAQAYQEVMDAPIESLRKSTVFQSLSKELGSEDAARKAIADRMSIQTAKDTALSTGLIGAAMGGGAVGSLLNKFAVKQGANEVGRLGAKAAAKEVLKDGAKEFAEEFAQSGPEHYLQNAAKRDYLDPTIDPSTGMLRASLEGGVVGMGQGMGMSGGAHAVNRLLARNEPQPSQPANTPQQQPNTKPSSTPKSAASYDPIAPNQHALLRRMGIDADPVADEAAASVESIFGTGDPTAGLVASVMRGDAMQPIHDMAAVRANTVLPVGSNEGGLYEPQWLPDAASGESANGMRMPRRGFDSQEQLIANAGMDAQDMQRKADIASQVDAAWAQQQNPVQKARELESLAQESAVPVAIDRAEQSNQINQALANAAGDGVAVPNAMQLALQRAKAGGEAKLDGVVDVTPPASVESKAPNISKEAPNTSDQAPNISSEPALTMQQNERGQWMIKGDMAQHAQTIRDALPGTKLVVSQKSGQALVQMPADKNTGKQGKAIRKALDHLLLSGEQLAARDQQRADASERAKAANRHAQQIDPERDDIVNAVAKLGGIDTEQALSEWWRGQRETVGHYNAEVPGNLRRQGVFAFKRGGMTIDDMVRHLEGEGYLPHNATPNDLLDALENRSKHPAGYEADARREFDARQQEEQANAPGEFQQAYDEGGFADEFTKRELEEETDYFELNRQNREAAEDAAATAKAAALDALIDNAPVIPSRPGPVTEEELDAIFGQQSRNAAAEGAQTDREPAAGRSMEGAESGTATAEAAPEEDGFDLAGYTESDLRRQGREAEQQQREVERQRAAADKARQDEETRKEIRRRSEAAADTFTLGGNAEDNLTGQGGLFDAPAETIHKPINMVSKSDGSGFASRDALRAAATRDGVPQSSLIEKRDEAGNWIGLRHEPDGAIDRIITDQSRAGKVIGTSVRDLHSDDVYTLLMAASSKKQINAIADYIGKYAPRAAADAVKSRIDSALKQKGWATEESLYGGGLFSVAKGVRTAWADDMPDAIIQAPLNAMKDHPDYVAAKAGDVDAAARVVAATMQQTKIDEIRRLIGDRTPVIVPVHARESEGVNELPMAYANALGSVLGLDVTDTVIQAERVNRSSGDGWYRLANPVPFSGDVEPGVEYVLIVDDTLTQGGTLAGLKGHIESQGGKVILASTLTGKQYSAKLSLAKSTLKALRSQYGQLENWWRNTFGYGFDRLTEWEARYILASGKNADAIRTTISERRREARLRTDERDSQGESAAVPLKDAPRHSFAGRTARTADAHALSNAQSRLDVGDDAETVRQNTGWFKGADGKWRFEIDDSNAQLKRDSRDADQYADIFDEAASHAVPLADMLDHPALFAAYPQLKSAKVVVDHSLEVGGTYSDATRTITVKDPYSYSDGHDELKSVLLHEIQHAIQSKEGFALGTRPSYFDNQIAIANDDVKLWYAIKLIKSEMSRGLSGKKALASVIDAGINADEDHLDAAKSIRAEDIERYLNDAYAYVSKFESSYNMYWKAGGEVEARNVQARANLTADQRRNTPPSQTADVADQDVILVYNGKEMAHAPAIANAKDHTRTHGMPAKDLQAIIAKALPAHLRERVKVAQSRSNNAQQSARSEDRDLTEAEYDPATGQLTLYADAIPTPERALFVLSHELTHYGLDAKYGFGLSSILLEARNNPMIAKLAAAIAVDRGMAVNSVRQDIADARGVPVARVARSAAVHRLQVETANEALAELNAAIERNDFAYLQDRYGVAVPKMMRNNLRGRLSRLAASVKAWLAKLTGKQASDYSDKQVWDLLAGVRETVRGGGKEAGKGRESGDTLAESGDEWRDSGEKVAETMSSQSPSPIDAHRAIRRVLQALASVHNTGNDLFSYPKPSDSLKDIGDIAGVIDPGMKVGKPIIDKQTGDQNYIVTMPNGGTATIVVAGNVVYIDASQLEKTTGGGSMLYALAGAFAHNNGKVFHGDPADLSAVALFRRTENMASLALKYGTTDFIAPHFKQVDPTARRAFDPLEGRERTILWKESDKPIIERAASLPWGNDQDANFDNLMRASHDNTLSLVPELRDIHYDLANRQFVDGRGNVVTDADFKTILEGAAIRLRREGLGQLTAGQEDVQAKVGPWSVVGSRTAKSAIIYASLLRESRSDGGRRRILDWASSQLWGGGVIDPALRRTRYSKKQKQPDSAGFSLSEETKTQAAKTINVDGVTRPTTNSNGQPIAQTEEGLRNFWRWFGDSKVVDKDGKPLVVYHGGNVNDVFDKKFNGTGGGREGGFFFTPDIRQARDYAGTGDVKRVYLSLQNPAMTDVQLEIDEAQAALDSGYDGYWVIDDDLVDESEIVVFDPTQIKSATGNRGTFNSSDPNILRSTAPKQPASAGFSLSEETKTQAAQREVQDNMNRWKQVLENVREQGGQVDEQNDVYGAEERFHGRAATRIEDFARDEVEPLMERLADSGHTLQEVEQYLLAQHAEEANARIREIDDSRDTAFGMEDGEAQSILAKFAALPDAAEFKRLANDFRRISEGTLSLYVKAGIVAPDSAHAMRLAYQFYVPVKGGDEDQAARQGTGKGLSVNGKQKRRMGHDMRDEHVLENMLRDRQRAIVLAEKNNVGTYLLDLIERNPDPKLWTVNVLPKQKVLRDQVSYVVELNGQMLDAFNSMEAARVFIQAEAARTGSKPGAFAVSKSSDPYVTMMAKPTLQDHEVQVYVQGRAVRIQLHDPILAGQYRRMGTEQMGRIIEAGKSLNRWLSKVYTGYNPEFFVKNVVRDLFAGTINLTADQGGKVAAKALSHWPKAGAAMFRFALTGKAPAGEYGKALQRYRAAGGSTGAAYMGDLERQADTLQTLYENYSGAMAAMQEGKPVKAAKIATRKLLGGLAHWFEVWNQAGENAFRLATFMAMEDAGKTVAQSSSMAKNVTVNFNRKGELTPQLGGLYLFFNPGVQGTARLWQSLAGKDTKHKKLAWALVGSMAVAALALATMNRWIDEDEWEAIPDSVKDRNLIIFLGGKRHITIPMPYGFSFFVSLANRLDAVMHGESAEKASIRLASAVFENFSPVGNPVGDDPKLENTLLLLPTALKIPALPAANLSGFGGQMRPEYDRSQPDNEKMWRGTRGSMYDKAAQAISGGAESIGIGSRYENDWADISPETIKYLVKTLTGGTGSFMADSASLLNVLASGSAPDVSEVPFVRSGMRESTVKDARARFHELGNEAKEHVAAWKRAVDAGDDKAATEYEQDGELMAMGEMLEGYRKQAKSLRDLMALEMQREDLTLAEKRMKQKAYENQEAEVYREFIRQFKH